MIPNRSVPASTGAPRVQLVFGHGAVILTARNTEGRGAELVRVADADRHHEHGTLR